MLGGRNTTEVDSTTLTRPRPREKVKVKARRARQSESEDLLTTPQNRRSTNTGTEWPKSNRKAVDLENSRNIG